MQCASMQMPVVANACLAYAQNLQCFYGYDEEKVKKFICSNFDLNAIKFARQMIFTYCNRTSAYVYNGPSDDKSEYEKMVHASEGIYSQLDLLRNGKCPPLVIACPSSELHILGSVKSSTQNTASDERLKKLEESVADLSKTMSSIVNKSRCSPDESASMVRPRSPSVKRNRSTDSDVNDGFSVSKRQIKRMKKASKPSAGDINGDSEVEQSTPRRDSTKKTFTWGKSDETTAGFSGMVPDAFIYSCSLDTEESVIKNHLSKRGLKIKNVELKSHKDATTKSFKVSVETLDDFEKLVSGDHIPKCAKVRKYIYFKQRSSGKVMLSQGSSAASFRDRPIRDDKMQRNYVDTLGNSLATSVTSIGLNVS